MVSGRSLAIALALLALPGVARAEEPAAPPAAPAPVPRVHHAAVSSAPPGERLSIKASIEHPELVRSAVLVYQGATGEVRAVPFLRGGTGEGYVAVIPGEAVKAPGLSYTIELERTNGERVYAFASRARMHPVSVIEERMDARERATLKRLGGRRSVVTAGGEYVGFGPTRGESTIPCAAGQSACAAGAPIVPEVDEQYYRIEGSYTYRPLRTVAEFGFRLGVVRGRSLVPLSEYDEERYKVGLNFGAARIRLRIHDLWNQEFEVLTSVTEVGFSVGMGTTTLIGDPYGSKLVLGIESIGLGDSASFGTRIFSRLDLTAGERLMVSPIVEITDMPNADAFGVRLLGEVGVQIGWGLSVQLRGGYQARRSTSGGPGVGGSVSFAF